MYQARHNRYQFRQQNLEKLIVLTEAERKELEEMEATILKGSSEDKKALVTSFLSDSKRFHQVFKFYFNSDIFEKFLEDDQFSQGEAFKRILREWKYLDVEIESFDQRQDTKETVTLLDQCVAAHLLSQYELFKKGQIPAMSETMGMYCLDLACEMGSFQALFKRCILNQNKIVKAATLHPKDPHDELAQVIMDTDRLGNYYWTTGLLHGVKILRNIGNVFLNKKSEENKKTPVDVAYVGLLEDLARICYDKAVQKFFLAQVMNEKAELATDKKITNKMLGAEGLTLLGYDNWEKPKNELLKVLGALTAKFHPDVQTREIGVMAHNPVTILEHLAKLEKDKREDAKNIFKEYYTGPTELALKSTG